MSFVGCLDGLQASYTCSECQIKSVVVDREGEVCVQCGLRQAVGNLDFHPYALHTEEGDQTVQHADQRSAADQYLSLFRDMVSGKKDTLMATRISLEPTEKSGELGGAAQRLCGLHEPRETDSHVKGYQRGQTLIDKLLRYLMVRCGFGDDLHRRLVARASESWFQYCSNLVKTAATRFYLLDLEAVALAVSNVMREGVFVDPDLVVEFVYSLGTEQKMSPGEFKHQLGARLEALKTSTARVSGVKRPRGACHTARRAVKLAPSSVKETDLHFAAVRNHTLKAVDVFAGLKKLTLEQQQEVKRVASETLCPEYVSSFLKHEAMEKAQTYLLKRAPMVGALMAREAFSRWAPQASAQQPTEQRFKARRAATTAKQFKLKQEVKGWRVTRQELMKACSSCTISKVTQLLKHLNEMGFDLRGHHA